jgi:VanZ family protein
MRARRILVLLWVAGTLAFATHLGSSERTQGLVLPILEDFGLDRLWALRVHKGLRKLGHVLGYAGFGMLVWWALAGTGRRATKAFLVVVALATIDEIFQSFSAGRGASVLDVVLDVAAGGLAVLWLDRRARRRPAVPIQDQS